MSSSTTDTTDAAPPPLWRRVVEWQRKGISQHNYRWRKGLFWALVTPGFLGTIPILAKVAYAADVGVLTVVAFRTLTAAFMLWLALGLFSRQYIRTSLPTLISSLIAGGINGIGSLFFYSSLTLIDASLGQLINITYLILVTVLLRLVGQVISWLTLLRTGLAIFGIYMLTVGGIGEPNWLGVGMMFIGALTFAIQLVLSQRILLDSPAQTVTLYMVTAMAIVVTVAWLLFPTDLTTISMPGWRAIILMGLVTGLSRLTLFMGVKHLGSIQAALLSILEVVVSIVLAIIFLGEHLTLVQWLGAGVVMVSILLVRYEHGLPKFIDWWQFALRWRLRRQLPHNFPDDQ